MKRSVLSISALGLLIIIGLFSSSFRLRPGYLAGNRIQNFYISNFFNTNIPSVSSWRANSVMSTNIEDVMSPHWYTNNGPTLIYGGVASGSSNGLNGDGKNTIGYGSCGNPDAGGCTNQTNTIGSYNEVDIIINSGFSLPFGNGAGNTVDRRSILAHELGHAIGHDHTRRSGRLMEANWQSGSNSIRACGRDCQRGFHCIYDNMFCEDDEDNPGAIEGVILDVTVNNGETLITWEVENLDFITENVLHFNVFNKSCTDDGISIHSSLNEKVINVSDLNAYSLNLDKSKYSDSNEIFIEIVTDKYSTMRKVEINKL